MLQSRTNLLDKFSKFPKLPKIPSTTDPSKFIPPLITINPQFPELPKINIFFYITLLLHSIPNCSSKSKFRRIKIYNNSPPQPETAYGFLSSTPLPPDKPITNKCFSFFSTHISKRIEHAYPLLRLRSAGQRQASRKLKVNGTRARIRIYTHR